MSAPDVAIWAQETVQAPAEQVAQKYNLTVSDAERIQDMVSSLLAELEVAA